MESNGHLTRSSPSSVLLGQNMKLNPIKSKFILCLCKFVLTNTKRDDGLKKTLLICTVKTSRPINLCSFLFAWASVCVCIVVRAQKLTHAVYCKVVSWSAPLKLHIAPGAVNVYVNIFY